MNERIERFIRRQPEINIVFLAVLLVFIVGGINNVVGPNVFVAFYYLVPIALVSWYLSKRDGEIVSFLSGVAVFLTGWSHHPSDEPITILLGNTALALAFFFIFSRMLQNIRVMMIQERERASHDFLTGVANGRHFYEVAAKEIERMRRYEKPFSVAYIDLDNFRTVNDTQGQNQGDRILRALADSMESTLRMTDTVGRLGGDEFVVLLPESDYDAARIALRKVLTNLSHLMRQNNWSLTFSIGMVTFNGPPETVDEMIRLVDEVMCSVKESTKNGIKHIIWRSAHAIQ